MFGQTRGLFYGQTRESAPTTGGDDGDGEAIFYSTSGAIKAMERCFYGYADVLLWRWSGALWGARGVLCRGKEQCFAGDNTPVVQSFICGEKSGAYLLGG